MLLTAVLLAASFVPASQTDATTCTFVCKHVTNVVQPKETKVDCPVVLADGTRSAGDFVIGRRAFAGLQLHLFYQETNKETKKKEFATYPSSPLMTDAQGAVEGYKYFTRDATYFGYFAGRELSAKELEGLQGAGPSQLFKFVLTDGWSGSACEVKAQGDSFQITLNASLPLWLARLQTVEAANAKAVASGAKHDHFRSLTQVRKLMYGKDTATNVLVGSPWDLVIDRGGIGELYDWDSGTGKVSSLLVPFNVLEDLSFRYQRDAEDSSRLRVTEGGARCRVQRSDHVLLEDGTVVQIGHVLTGIEVLIAGPQRLFEKRIKDPQAFVTWAGDLGQLVCRGMTQTPSEKPVEASFSDIRKLKASDAQLLGDLVGVVLGVEHSDEILAGSARLSDVLATHFLDADWKRRTAEAFCTAQGIDSAKLANNEPEAVATLEDGVLRGARTWCLTESIANFAVYAIDGDGGKASKREAELSSEATGILRELLQRMLKK